MGASESEIQREIMDWLKAQGHYVWRNYLGGVKRSGVGVTKNPCKGMPDIMGLLRGTEGRLFGIEVKTKKGKTAEHQSTKIDELVSNGAVAFVARDLADVKKLLVT